MTEKMRPFYTHGARFRNPHKAELRFIQWESGLCNPDTGYMPPPCPPDADMILVDQTIIRKATDLINALFQFPHSEVVARTKAVMAEVHEHKISARLSAHILRAFADFSASGNMPPLVHFHPPSGGQLIAPYYRLFYRCALQALTKGGNHHPQALAAWVIKTNQGWLRSSINNIVTQATPAAVVAPNPAPPPVVQPKRNTSRAPSSSINR